MIKPTPARLSFASLTARPQKSACLQGFSKGNSEFQKMARLTDHESISQMGRVYVEKQKVKVVKLIGDPEKNISELVEGLGCICGCKNEFKSVANLLMEKIYKLRRERNRLREETSCDQTPVKKVNNLKKSKDAETNTEDFYDTELLRDQLKSLPTEEVPYIQIMQNPKEHLLSINAEQIEQLFGSFKVQNALFDNLNETNLLQTSMRSSQEESFRDMRPKSRKILEEFNHNTERNEIRIKDANQFVKKNHINMNTLQNFIEKINCAKELGRYDENKRRKALF